MNDVTATADRIEAVLRAVVSASSGSSPSPRDYFLLFDQDRSDYWFIGFLFENSKLLREALENGMCLWVHNRATDLIASSDLASELRHYVVFDFGELPSKNEQRQELYDKHYRALQALHHEGGSGKVSTCGLCGHSVDEHQMRGFTEEGASAPTKGWMMCPHQSCFCFRTWSLRSGA
jgi:hypothetical protein